jgi:hypothetical protein
MRADRVEFSWDENKSSWLIRIQAGEEVIQRHCTLSRGADERTLQTAIEKVVVDEGYEIDPGNIVHGQAQQT